MTAFDLWGHLTPSGVSFKSATCRKRIKKNKGGGGQEEKGEDDRLKKGKNVFLQMHHGRKE